MSWNYRVLKRTIKATGEERWGIHEVFYDDDGSLDTATTEPIAIEADSLDELRVDLEHVQRALGRPVLTLDDFPSGRAKA